MNVSGSSHLNSLYSANQGINKSAERISSGQRINSAADDAAGLAISNGLTGEIRGINQSIRNANDGVSMLQTAGAGLQNITDGVQRLRELSLQASNGILSDSDRSAINKEAQQLVEAIGQAVEGTSFNGKSLLNSDSKTGLQVGPEEGETVDIELGDFAQLLEDSGFNSLDLSTAEGASAALGALGEVQAGVDQANAQIGAQINRLDSTVNNLSNSSIRAQESRSRISDADMAKEITDMVNQQVQRDASIAMLALSNQNKGNVLKLLGG